MRRVEVNRVAIAESGEVRVYPDISSAEDYAHIFRAATGVRWDETDRSLYSEVPRKLRHSEWYKIIRDSLIQEFGDHLVLTDRTAWQNVGEEVREEIERVSANGAA